MRILFHANAPWAATGYGKQANLWVPLLKSLGHEVAVSAFYGLHGAPITWNGIDVYPGGLDAWGMDVVSGHYRHFKADLLFTLCDVWAADLGMTRGLNVAHWTPVDCEPLGIADGMRLNESGGVPVAMSQFGLAQLERERFEALYIPHGVDVEVFRPPLDRTALRESMGVAGRFVIGINAANQDRSRKGFPEQFGAFARFRQKHPDALMLVNTKADNNEGGGLDLYALASEFDISEHVWFADQETYKSGMVDDEALARWYGCLDVLSNCSWAEGFGLPVLEAQACGVPVVVTKAASMTELCGAGWLASGERFWNYLHQAWWVKPSVAAIVRCYEQAYKGADRLRDRARRFALRYYDAELVLREHWRPVLEKLEAGL